MQSLNIPGAVDMIPLPKKGKKHLGEKALNTGSIKS